MDLTGSRLEETAASKTARELLRGDVAMAYDDSAIIVQTSLPPHCVVLLTVELSSDARGGDEQG
jgi:hypothetical protein